MITIRAQTADRPHHIGIDLYFVLMSCCRKHDLEWQRVQLQRASNLIIYTGPVPDENMRYDEQQADDQDHEKELDAPERHEYGASPWRVLVCHGSRYQEEVVY